MEQATKKKALIVGSLLVIAGVVGYLLWSNKKQKKSADTPPADIGGGVSGDASQTPKTQVTTSGVISTSSGSPFSNADDIKKFQDWMDTNHPNWVSGKNLNKGSGYGTYGPSTAKAWKSYGTEYSTPKTTTTTTTTAASSTFNVGDNVYIKGEQAGVFSYPSSTYLSGLVKKAVFLDQPIGTVVAVGPKNGSDQWYKVNVPKYQPYDKTNDVYGAMTSNTQTMYMHEWNLQKTPY